MKNGGKQRKRQKKRRKTAKKAGKMAKPAKNDEKRQKTLEKRQNGKKKLWGPPLTMKIILGAASKFFLALVFGPFNFFDPQLFGPH